jgi:hypothetical protein|eukprot:XP_008660675.1 uncharacterized protein LOC103639729 [Zea mays]
MASPAAAWERPRHGHGGRKHDPLSGPPGGACSGGARLRPGGRGVPAAHGPGQAGAMAMAALGIGAAAPDAHGCGSSGSTRARLPRGGVGCTGVRPSDPRWLAAGRRTRAGTAPRRRRAHRRRFGCPAWARGAPDGARRRAGSRPPTRAGEVPAARRPPAPTTQARKQAPPTVLDGARVRDPRRARVRPDEAQPWSTGAGVAPVARPVGTDAARRRAAPSNGHDRGRPRRGRKAPTPVPAKARGQPLPGGRGLGAGSGHGGRGPVRNPGASALAPAPGTGAANPASARQAPLLFALSDRHFPLNDGDQSNK